MSSALDNSSNALPELGVALQVTGQPVQVVVIAADVINVGVRAGVSLLRGEGHQRRVRGRLQDEIG